MSKFLYNFVKITGILPWLFCFKTKVYYQNKKTQSKKIKGSAIIMSNHTAVSDFIAWMYVFFGRNIHTIMAELLFRKNKFMNWFLPRMGGIKVDRDAKEFGFIKKSCEILEKGGVIEIYPEARIPKEGEARPLEFKPSAAYIAIRSGSPIIPVYTDGVYYKKKRNRVIIGEKIYPKDIIDQNKTERENVEILTAFVRNRIVELGNELEQRKQKGKKA